MSVPDDLTPGADAPALPGRVIVRETFEDALDAAASDLFLHAGQCVRTLGDFHLVLSAGPLQDRLYVRLMVDPKFRGLPWARTHLWLAGEGACSPAASGSVYREIRETLVDHAGLPLEQTHPVMGDDPDGAAAYERELRETLAWREPGHDRLDCVVLAAGARGFEGWRATDLGADALVAGHAEGVALTARAINGARLIIVLASGEGGRGGMDGASVGGLEPVGGELHWYADASAVGVAE